MSAHRNRRRHAEGRLRYAWFRAADEARQNARFTRWEAPERARLCRGDLRLESWTRTLRLARTIADLDGSDGVRRLHVAEALIYRRSGVEGAVQRALLVSS